jgi:hypothetical protein
MKKCSGIIYKINNKSFCVGGKKIRKVKRKLNVNKILY